MEKVIVRSWDCLFDCDLVECSQSRGVPQIIVCGLKKDESIQLLKNKENLGIMVNCLNALGGNFVYKPVREINTLEELEEFQKELADNNRYYNRVKNNFAFFTSTQLVQTIEGVEKEFNVKLNILKED